MSVCTNSVNRDIFCVTICSVRVQIFFLPFSYYSSRAVCGSHWWQITMMDIFSISENKKRHQPVTTSTIGLNIWLSLQINQNQWFHILGHGFVKKYSDIWSDQTFPFAKRDQASRRLPILYLYFSTTTSLTILPPQTPPPTSPPTPPSSRTAIDITFLSETAPDLKKWTKHQMVKRPYRSEPRTLCDQLEGHR